MTVAPTIEETTAFESPGASESWTLATPASDGDVLVILAAGAVTSARIRAVMIQGTLRKAIDVDLFTESTDEGLPSTCAGWVVPLRAGDETVLVLFNAPGTWGLCAFAHVSGTPGIPTDWALYWNTRDAGQVMRTQPFDALDVGVYLAVCVVVGASVAFTAPAGWTGVETVATGAGSAQFASGPIAAAGRQSGVPWQAGTVPVGSTGEVFWFAVYGLGLRVRDAGAWAQGGNMALVRAGSSEPTPPLFPPDRVLPRTPPDGPGVRVPTPPWIPDGGPYRT